MKIKDLEKLLEEGKVEEAAETVLEELGDAAAEPVATEDKEPSTEEVKVDEKDLGEVQTSEEIPAKEPAVEAKAEEVAETEEVKAETVTEEVETPEVPAESAKEDDEVKSEEPTAEVPEVKEEEVTGEVSEKEDLEPVEISEDYEITDEDYLAWLDENGYEPDEENLATLKEEILTDKELQENFLHGIAARIKNKFADDKRARTAAKEASLKTAKSDDECKAIKEEVVLAQKLIGFLHAAFIGQLKWAVAANKNAIAAIKSAKQGGVEESAQFNEFMGLQLL